MILKTQKKYLSNWSLQSKKYNRNRKNLHIVEFNKQYHNIDKNNIRYQLFYNKKFTRNYMEDDKLISQYCCILYIIIYYCILLYNYIEFNG